MLVSFLGLLLWIGIILSCFGSGLDFLGAGLSSSSGGPYIGLSRPQAFLGASGLFVCPQVLLRL